jgi:hypothetical protein
MLEKLTIHNQDTKERFQVLFNPAEYTLDDANSWEEQPREGRKPELQFTGQALKTLSMELFLDTYEQGEDVRTHTGKVARLLRVGPSDSDGKRPPVCELSWGPQDPGAGDFPFVGVLESLKQQFVLFLADGTPVRARLSVSFKEFRSPEEHEQEQTRRGSFPAQTHTVRAGETLSGIAAERWRRPELWRLIAETNRIDDPRRLDPGRLLTVPAIDDRGNLL